MNRIKTRKMVLLIIIIILGITFIFSTIKYSTINLNSGKNEGMNLNEKNLKNSANSGIIHIDNNWSYTEGNYSWCTGSGTFPDPYIIEDLIIDGERSKNCILIENSNLYFKIENCTVYNSLDIPNAGIRLSNVNNSQLISNNCSYNNRGIYLTSCYNNTILGNTVSKNEGEGISLKNSDYNNIQGNTANDNTLWNEFIVYGKGIHLDYCNNNTIVGNTVNDNGAGIYLNSGDNNTVLANIAISNNDFGVFHDSGYFSEISGNTANFNEYGIYLENLYNGSSSGNTLNYNDIGLFLLHSEDDDISGNIANYNQYYGFFLSYSYNNDIKGNIANYNEYGIFLRRSTKNIISGNDFIKNDICWKELNCNGNNFENNNCGGLRIPGYSILIIIATIFGLSIIPGIHLSKTRKR